MNSISTTISRPENITDKKEGSPPAAGSPPHANKKLQVSYPLILRKTLNNFDLTQL
jgi:hypothetical protein